MDFNGWLKNVSGAPRINEKPFYLDSFEKCRDCKLFCVNGSNENANLDHMYT